MTTIAHEDRRTYNRALETWLPSDVRLAARTSDIAPRRVLAREIVAAFNRFRAWRKDEDWERFLKLRREWLGN